MKKTKYLNRFIYLMLLLSLFSLTADAQRKKDLEKARRLVKQAEQFFNQKNYRGAVDKYAEAIAVVPQQPGAYFGKGYAHYYLNEYDQSIAELTRAEAQGYEKPLEIYKIRWQLNYEAKNYDAALNDAIEASKLDPNNATYTIAVGDIYRMRENYAEAARYYKKAVEQDKNNSDVSYFLALSYAKLGDTEGQGRAALEALNRKTKYVAESNFYVAEWLSKDKKFDEAVPYYEKAISLNTNVPYATYGLLSDIYRSRNEFDKAIAITRKGLQAFPKDANLYTSLAWYYSLADRPQDAIIAAKSAVNLSPDMAMAYTNLCRAYNDAKEYQMAIGSCSTAIRLNPGDGETYLYMARAHEFLKQNDKAFDYYKKAVEGLIKFTAENPDYSDGFYLLGNAYFAIKKDNEAIAAYNKCLALSPRFARARFSLGYTYLIKGDKAKAREQYDLLLPVDKNLAEKLRQAIEK